MTAAEAIHVLRRLLEQLDEDPADVADNVLRCVLELLVEELGLEVQR